jgi:hypothetical protein
VLGPDVVVPDSEERERAVLGELGVPLDHGRPRRVDGATLGDLQVHLLPPGGFTIPGEQVDPDTHDDV